MGSNRRTFLKGLGVVSGAAALSGMIKFPGSTLAQQIESIAGKTLPSPGQCGIDHLVVVMMENRSFDHLFGWIPGALGKQAGLTYRDSSGVAHKTSHLAPDFTGCGHPDPDHSYEGGRVQYNDKRMDGFLLDTENDIYAIGYYTQNDRPFHNSLALEYTVCDRYFCSILGPTFPNRIFSHAAQTDRLSNTFVLSTLPTIWDRLQTAGVSATYYFSNLPFLGLWGPKYVPISRPYAQFLVDAAAGTLPAVSFIDPKFTVTDTGDGNDDHPHADIRAGDAFLAQTFAAVSQGPLWSKTAFVITYDEWGGFFDQVPPPRAAAANLVDGDIVDGKTLLGFRIPVCVASPFTRNRHVNGSARVIGSVFDHTSVLKFIEWRWNLVALTPRDASSDVNNLAHVFDFDRPEFSVPDLPNPSAPPPQPCGQPVSAAPQAMAAANGEPESNIWLGLKNSGLLDAWNLPEQ